MIIVRVMGGLGNQMQQYALYRKLEMLGRDAGLDFSWFDREIQEKMQAPREPWHVWPWIARLSVPTA